MVGQFDEHTFRQYLLGQLADDRQSEIEQHLFTDDQLLEDLLLAEDELIDEYLGGKVTRDERARFEQHFLATPERKQKLRFAQALRKYVSTNPARATLTAPSKGAVQSWWRQPFFTSPWALAAAVLIVIGLVTIVWRGFVYQSEVDKGLLALNEAYREGRPVESRISALTSYAPFSPQRGGAQKVDDEARRRAELTLLYAVRDHPDAKAYHALGNVHLAKREFDQAIDHFERAIKTDPNNPKIYSDLGAARLEAGEEAKQNNELGKAFALLAQSLDDINRALRLDPGLLEALYNKAICLQEMKLRDKAKEAWQEYLRHDSQSKWAEEANRHLQSILDRSTSPPTAPELLQNFLAAFTASDDEGAWRVMSQNREFITGKMVPPQLARTYIATKLSAKPQSAQTMLRAFLYAGELDLKRGGDPYTSELAQYYASSSPQQQQLLAQALANIDDGYKLCLDTKYGPAAERFAEAGTQFNRAGNVWESKLASYWTSYCYTQLDRIPESTNLLKAVAEFCRMRNYKWLLAQADEWLATNSSILSEHSDSIKYHQESLDLAAAIDDTYQMQKSLTALGYEQAYMQQPDLSLGYYYRSLTLASESNGSPRQAWRNLLYTTSALFTFRHYEAAAAFGDEALHLGQKEFNDPSLSYMLHLQLGQIYSRLQRFDEAVIQANQGFQVAQLVIDQSARQKSTAAAFLKQAQIWREAGDNQQALRFYNQAIAIYDTMNFNLYRYAAYKGKLLSSLAVNDEAAVERDLPLLLQMFDRYRTQIREEQYRNSFFDTEQGVYDIAIDHEYQRGNFAKAVNHAESAHGRSLLDALHQTTRLETTAAGADLVSSQVAQPLDVEVIRQQLPEQLTVLMFTVLPEKLLIWRISREGRNVDEREITAEELRNDVLAYVQALKEGSSGSTRALAGSKELYRILLGSLNKSPHGPEKLCIIPDKFLSYLPFAALTSPDTGKYLIEDWPIFYAASLNVLWKCSQEAQRRPRLDQGPMVSIGNPSFNRQHYPALATLTAAEREAKEIARDVSGSISLLGSEATKKDSLRAMQSAEIIHFAGHYVVDDSNPLLSKMLLAAREGDTVDLQASVLTASEIIQHSFNHTKLIVLSACQTGIDKYYNGEGAVGLARAFIEARIPLVVASQWPVDSEATADLMVSLYHYRRSGLSTIDALRAAQVNALRGSNDLYREPHNWAAFVCVGGYTEY